MSAGVTVIHLGFRSDFFIWKSEKFVVAAAVGRVGNALRGVHAPGIPRIGRDGDIYSASDTRRDAIAATQGRVSS
jgi:hypothetical protein